MSLNFDDVPVQNLEQLRPRLTQLTHSLRKLEDSMAASATLPNWSNLQNQYNVILSQLTSFSRTMDLNKDVLKHTNVYPNTEFDTTQFEGLLTTLLRKKHLPEVAEWIESNMTDVSRERLAKDDQVAAEYLRLSEELLGEFSFDDDTPLQGSDKPEPPGVDVYKYMFGGGAK
ncbi:hypothetical protein KL949_002554 [Ogataea haglerorum]|uniref:uncharacterized protein n=1 Tax=Ogataea haglerorum TaxID=1937702 RepID=UPI001C8A03BB|nr:uncharacterized protein KL911_004673 [Ogataea haglerorum]KAG7691509.1 hypothetical protein KL915_005256 [Ogataea haglerorum]KAG7713097.1 hypothetical protein KL913_005324 [Ogataea haglerorum]KAG7719562.1 hypothetical protein KL949_002554 [Ogataea haglerorum]KAG7729042.1 hypothetical protein KL948_004079 [Ogataea haglerorum]KAG7738108.1 hypothetical protein KL923_003655 [Ogataea haglerorum]